MIIKETIMNRKETTKDVGIELINNDIQTTNLFVPMIKFWTATVTVLFKWKNSASVVFKPVSQIFSFGFLFRV